MEHRLKRIFDYQRFSKNERLNEIISDTENRYSELNEDELFMVAAAGNIEMTSKLLERKDEHGKKF